MASCRLTLIRPPRVKRTNFSLGLEKQKTADGTFRKITTIPIRRSQFLTSFQSGPQTVVCTKHLSRLSGADELGNPIQPETSQEEPAPRRPRNSSVPSYRPTQKVGLNPQGSSRYLQARERGRTRQTPFRHRDWVGAQAGVQSIARDQGEAPKCTGGVKAPGERMHRKPG